jgi:peptidoglycan/LPS O-acetylase OafA/YrhL
LALLSGASQITRKQVLTWSIAVGGFGGVAYVGGAFLGAMARNSVLGSSVVFGVVAMATSGVIGLAIAARDLKALAILRTPVARFFGDISYWTYLFHGLMVNLALRLTLGWKPGWGTYLAMTGIVFSACIVTGIAVRHWIELPTQALKKRFH